MAELPKIFIYTTLEKWEGVTDRTPYKNSIVFIKSNDGAKGIKIYTQGVEFDTELTPAEVETIINNYVVNGDNIDVSVVDGKLVISAPYVATKEFVSNALTAPMELSLEVQDNKGQFTQHFTNLEGVEVTSKSAIIEGSENVTLTQTDYGFKIETKDTKLTSAIISADELTVDNNMVAVVSNIDTELTVTNGKSISGTFTAVTVPTAAYVDAVKTGLKGDVKSLDTLGKLEDAINTCSKTYTIENVTDGLGANIQTKYQLFETVGENKTAVVGSVVEIPKDVALIKVEKTTNTSGDHLVVFTYRLSDGSETTVELDLSDYVTETEFGNGIEVVNGVASVKRDSTSEEYLILSANGIKVSGIGDAISTAIKDLDAEANSTDGKNVQVKVTEVAGKITAVNVTETDIASAQSLAALTTEVAENEAVTAAALTDLNSKIEGINETIAGLEGSVALVNGTEGEYVFVEKKAGYITSEHIAAIMNEAWTWGTI